MKKTEADALFGDPLSYSTYPYVSPATKQDVLNDNVKVIIKQVNKLVERINKIETRIELLDRDFFRRLKEHQTDFYEALQDINKELFDDHVRLQLLEESRGEQFPQLSKEWEIRR